MSQWHVTVLLLPLCLGQLQPVMNEKELKVFLDSVARRTPSQRGLGA